MTDLATQAHETTGMFLSMFKVDEERRLIFGRATAEEVDRSGEVADYEATKAAFKKWEEETLAATGGKSRGNVREMHKKDSAVGVVKEINYNDDAKAIDIVVKVVDPVAFDKAYHGVYSGFSIGGGYLKKVRQPDGTTRYHPRISEVSLVDRPCLASARFYDIVKADGTVEQREFRAVDAPEDQDAPLTKETEAISGADRLELINTLADGKLPGDASVEPEAVTDTREDAQPQDVNPDAGNAAATDETPVEKAAPMLFGDLFKASGKAPKAEPPVLFGDLYKWEERAHPRDATGRFIDAVEGAGIGALAGAAVGGAVGHIVHHADRGALAGAAVGAATGAYLKGRKTDAEIAREKIVAAVRRDDKEDAEKGAIDQVVGAITDVASHAASMAAATVMRKSEPVLFGELYKLQGDPAAWDETKHPRDESGRFTESTAGRIALGAGAVAIGAAGAALATVLSRGKALRNATKAVVNAQHAWTKTQAAAQTLREAVETVTDYAKHGPLAVKAKSAYKAAQAALGVAESDAAAALKGRKTFLETYNKDKVDLASKLKQADLTPEAKVELEGKLAALEAEHATWKETEEATRKVLDAAKSKHAEAKALHESANATASQAEADYKMLLETAKKGGMSDDVKRLADAVEALEAPTKRGGPTKAERQAKVDRIVEKLKQKADALDVESKALGEHFDATGHYAAQVESLWGAGRGANLIGRVKARFGGDLTHGMADEAVAQVKESVQRVIRHNKLYGARKDAVENVALKTYQRKYNEVLQEASDANASNPYFSHSPSDYAMAHEKALSAALAAGEGRATGLAGRGGKAAAIDDAVDGRKGRDGDGDGKKGEGAAGVVADAVRTLGSKAKDLFQTVANKAGKTGVAVGGALVGGAAYSYAEDKLHQMFGLKVAGVRNNPDGSQAIQLVREKDGKTENAGYVELTRDGEIRTFDFGKTSKVRDLSQPQQQPNQGGGGGNKPFFGDPITGDYDAIKQHVVAAADGISSETDRDRLIARINFGDVSRDQRQLILEQAGGFMSFDDVSAMKKWVNKRKERGAYSGPNGAAAKEADRQRIHAFENGKDRGDLFNLLNQIAKSDEPVLFEALYKRDFREEEHPRDERGRFEAAVGAAADRGFRNGVLTGAGLTLAAGAAAGLTWAALRGHGGVKLPKPPESVVAAAEKATATVKEAAPKARATRAAPVKRSLGMTEAQASLNDDIARKVKAAKGLNAKGRKVHDVASAKERNDIVGEMMDNQHILESEHVSKHLGDLEIGKVTSAILPTTARKKLANIIAGNEEKYASNPRLAAIDAFRIEHAPHIAPADRHELADTFMTRYGNLLTDDQAERLEAVLARTAHAAPKAELETIQIDAGMARRHGARTVGTAAAPQKRPAAAVLYDNLLGRALNKADLRKAEWDENEHPRDEDGKFTHDSKGYSIAAKKLSSEIAAKAGKPGSAKYDEAYHRAMIERDPKYRAENTQVIEDKRGREVRRGELEAIGFGTGLASGAALGALSPTPIVSVPVAAAAGAVGGAAKDVASAAVRHYRGQTPELFQKLPGGWLKLAAAGAFVGVKGAGKGGWRGMNYVSNAEGAKAQAIHRGINGLTAGMLAAVPAAHAAAWLYDQTGIGRISDALSGGYRRVEKADGFNAAADELVDTLRKDGRAGRDGDGDGILHEKDKAKKERAGNSFFEPSQIIGGALGLSGGGYAGMRAGEHLARHSKSRINAKIDRKVNLASKKVADTVGRASHLRLVASEVASGGGVAGRVASGLIEAADRAAPHTEVAGDIARRIVAAQAAGAAKFVARRAPILAGGVVMGLAGDAAGDKAARIVTGREQEDYRNVGTGGAVGAILGTLTARGLVPRRMMLSRAKRYGFMIGAGALGAGIGEVSGRQISRRTASDDKRAEASSYKADAGGDLAKSARGTDGDGDGILHEGKHGNRQRGSGSAIGEAISPDNASGIAEREVGSASNYLGWSLASGGLGLLLDRRAERKAAAGGSAKPSRLASIASKGGRGILGMGVGIAAGMAAEAVGGKVGAKIDDVLGTKTPEPPKGAVESAGEMLGGFAGSVLPGMVGMATAPVTGGGSLLAYAATDAAFSYAGSKAGGALGRLIDNYLA